MGLEFDQKSSFQKQINWLVRQVKCLYIRDCACKEANTLNHDDTQNISGTGPEYIHLNQAEFDSFVEVAADAITCIEGDLVDFTDPKCPAINLPDNVLVEGDAVEGLTGYGVLNSDPLNPVIQKIEDLPQDFFIACNYTDYPVMGNIMYYITDEVRSLDIGQLIGGNGVYSTRSVTILDKNTIATVGELYDDALGGDDNPIGDYFVLVLKDCKLVDNVLVIGNYSWNSLSAINRNPTTNTPYSLHSDVYHRGFLYYATRVSTSVVVSSQIIKVNPWDLTDIKYLSLPTTSGFFDNAIGDMQAYKDNIYLLGVRTSGTIYASFIRVDENLTEYEVMFQCGNVTSTKRLVNSTPFQIYNDKVYIPYRYGSSADLTLAYNTVGFFVYDLLKRTLITDTGNVTMMTGGTGSPVPHWLTVFNGKLLLHTASGNSNRRLIRFDVESMTFEASTPIPKSITNDNTITREGYILLNTELVYDGYLYKIHYKFNSGDAFQEIGFLGWYALGSPEYYVEKETLIDRTSRLINDGADGSGPYQSAAQVLAAIEAADEVFFYAISADRPATGVINKLYVVKTGGDKGIYQWNGTAYENLGGASGTAWGTITGTLASQTDLANAFAAKVGIGTDSTITFNAISAVSSLPGSPVATTLYVIEDGLLPSGVTLLTVPATTLILVPVTTDMYVRFSGTVCTVTLPAIIGSETLRVTFINRGSGNVTLNTNAAANDIDVAGVYTNVATILPGAKYTLINDGTKLVNL